MSFHRSLATTVASALLGVIAIASLVTAAFMGFAAWTISGDTPLADGGNPGFVAVSLIGALLVGFGLLAAVAARDEWEVRQRGRPLGLVVGITAALAAATALLTTRPDTTTPLLAVAIGLGVAATLAVAVDALTVSVAAEAPR